jgi:hypothetical protein
MRNIYVYMRRLYNDSYESYLTPVAQGKLSPNTPTLLTATWAYVKNPVFGTDVHDQTISLPGAHCWTSVTF